MHSTVRVLLLAAYSAFTVARVPAQPGPSTPDPVRIEQELARARDEKWPMVAVQIASGRYVAFEPARIKALAGNRVIVGGRFGWAEAALASTDEERIYFALKYALSFETSSPMATYTVTKAMEIEVARILPPSPLLDSGAGSNRKEWVGSVLRQFGASGATVAQMILENRKEAPKVNYDSFLVQLVNRGSTGLTPDMEAAFMDALTSPGTKRSWKVLQDSPSNQGEGNVLEMKLRLERVDETFLAVAYVRADRGSGDVRQRAFGRFFIGRKVEKDVRSLAELCR